MDKLQYDSFYKFIVSIGIVLIVAPLFCLHYLVSGSYDIIMTQEEANNLSEIIYVFLTIFLYLLKCPQSLILSALRAFCFCGKPRISRSIFLYFPCQSWLKSW